MAPFEAIENESMSSGPWTPKRYLPLTAKLLTFAAKGEPASGVSLPLRPAAKALTW